MWNFRKLLFLFGLILTLFPASAAHSQMRKTGLKSMVEPPPPPDEYEIRTQAIIQRHIDFPYPNPDQEDNPGGACWGKAAYALAALTQGNAQEIALANQRLLEMFALCPIPADTCWDRDCGMLSEFHLPQIVRIFQDQELYHKLTPQVKAELENQMWSLVVQRSRWDLAAESEWIYIGSENHDAMIRSNLYLACQRLAQLRGNDHELADGYTLGQHRNKWRDFYKRYFRARGKKGINAEIASPTYSKYTLACYYNLHDLSTNAIVRDLAGDFLTLYWADVAQEFLPAIGARGGAKTRYYQDANFYWNSDALWQMTWAMDWHQVQEPTNTNPAILSFAVTDYRLPEIVKWIATEPKPPFQYISRRFGRGVSWPGEGGEFQFEGGDADLVRTTFWTPDYVLGAFTVDPAEPYTNVHEQNRWMGVLAASHKNARVGVTGIGQVEDKKGYKEIQGISWNNTMILGGDPSAYQTDGVRIFLSYAGDIWANRHNYGGVPGTDDPSHTGWIYSQSGDAFFAIRIVNKDWRRTNYYSVEEEENFGNYLVLDDRWSPIIIHMGRRSDATFQAFKDAVEDSYLHYDGASGRLLYIPPFGGGMFTFYRNSYILPTVNVYGWEGLNPAKTYNSPYLDGTHGSDTVVVRWGEYLLPLYFGN